MTLSLTDTVLGGGPSYSSTFTYDTAGRPLSVSQGGSTATCGYVANSMLVSQTGYAHNGVSVMTTTQSPDTLNRMQSVATSAGATALSVSYHYNRANQRDRATLADNSYWVYGCDGLGQVISGKKYWSDHTAVAGQQFEYNFDTIGNRSGSSGTRSGGDACTVPQKSDQWLR